MGQLTAGCLKCRRCRCECGGSQAVRDCAGASERRVTLIHERPSACTYGTGCAADAADGKEDAVVKRLEMRVGEEQETTTS